MLSFLFVPHRYSATQAEYFYLLFINSLLTSRKFAKRIVYCLQKEIARNTIYLSVRQSLSNLNEEDCYKCYGVLKKPMT